MKRRKSSSLDTALRAVACHVEDAMLDIAAHDMYEDGRTADQLYNDVDVVADTCRDRLHDELWSNGIDPQDVSQWNAAVDVFTTKYVTHLPGLNKELKS